MEQKWIRILNVEDEDVDHMALLRMVKEKGLPYYVDRAASVTEADKLLKKEKFDIVLLDYMMPNGTGLDLLERVREIPSIFITGSGNEIVAVKAIKGGAYDYLLKDTACMYLELLPLVIEKALKRFEDEERLRRNYDELERMNKLFVGREIRMGELKKENAELKGRIIELEKRLKG